jgi:hypothetical protein
MKISVDKIVLENIGASFKDDQTGMDFQGRLGKFQTAFKKFDLDVFQSYIADFNPAADQF